MLMPTPLLRLPLTSPFPGACTCACACRQMPRDLVEKGEPMLVAKQGVLIQTQKKREDGWWFGFVVFNPQEHSRLHIGVDDIGRGEGEGDDDAARHPALGFAFAHADDGHDGGQLGR